MWLSYRTPFFDTSNVRRWCTIAQPQPQPQHSTALLNLTRDWREGITRGETPPKPVQFDALKGESRWTRGDCWYLGELTRARLRDWV